MVKCDFLSPKAIANRMKAKGLEQLRWYCQMCEKQCRDENGFKCHSMSESHQRQMELFGQNQHRYVEGFSKGFETSFMEHLKRSHRFSRILATVVYNEYISDRHHLHMNSTQWATLTEFVKHLGRTGKCKVEDTPKGWFITYIDRDSETLFKERWKNKRLKADIVEEERKEREIRKQIELAEKTVEAVSKVKEEEPFPFLKPEKIVFSFGSSSSRGIIGAGGLKEKRDHSRVAFDDDESEFRREKRKQSHGHSSALDELMKEEEKAKERSNRKGYWLFEGIIVKVTSDDSEEKGYYKKRGVVRKVIDKYIGEIEMLDTKHVLRIDQKELETVIPHIGSLVKIVNGAYRGSDARLLAVDEENVCAKVKVESGLYHGRVLKALSYEDICKIG